MKQRFLLVTTALPYANGPLHLGHMLEFIQTDIFVRFQKLYGNHCLYVCADDAHGTPIMLKAEQNNIKPEEFVKKIFNEHIKDLQDFIIEFDNYHTTHSSENEELVNIIYQKLLDHDDIEIKNIEQAFDPEKNIFLPDRYIQGTCPKCHAPNQYGDNCEKCGATYSPMELIDPKSVISNKTPITKESKHIFFKLNKYKEQLNSWLDTNVLQPEIINKLKEWFSSDLRSWDISRDHPYFGFKIPNFDNKYFYVWLDAPIGYLAAIKNLATKDPKISFNEICNKDSKYEIYHFIGKDIIYFHGLFWPAILLSSGFNMPKSIVTHGFLTIDEQKMSKSRGNFITARSYLNHLNPEYLRYYFATKLSNNIDDININLDDFVLRVNSDLIGKFINIASRSFSFINKYFDDTLADTIDYDVFNKIIAKEAEIAEFYENREFSRVTRTLSESFDYINQYIDSHKPWELIKTTNKKQVQVICTTAINVFKSLSIYLKPILPILVQKIKTLLNVKALTWQNIGEPLLCHKILPYTHLITRIEEANILNFKKEIMEPQEQNISNDNLITIDDFNKIELKIGKIIHAESVEEAESLLKLQLDTGEKIIQIFAGIKKTYEPKDLIDKLVIYVANLKPRKMRFGISEGMILAASFDKDTISLIHPDSGAKVGMRVK